MATIGQERMIDAVRSIGRRGPDTIPVGPDKTDAFGRRLLLDGQSVMLGRQVRMDAVDLHRELQSKGQLENILRGEVMWYDIRSTVWKDNPQLSTLIALSYAQTLIERTGQRDGHIIDLAIDCYPMHFDSMSWIADTLIRTGITQNGGGITYWGVQNGGAIRNLSQFRRASTGRDGNWIYGTISHVAKDTITGAKFGMGGQVFCGPDLMETLYGKLIRGDFPELEHISDPYDHIVTVGDTTMNNIAIAEDMIRARTGSTVPAERLLAGIRMGVNMCGSPVGKNLVDILTALGADVEIKNGTLNPNFNRSNIVDPNEHESEAMQLLAAESLQTGRTQAAVDPDGDRGTLIAEGGIPSGTELLLLATENLATYNPQGLPNDVIYDMRTGISMELLALALRGRGHSMDLIASEPGYPFFMENMGTHERAAIAVENTNHPFATPLTNPIWGAPHFYPGVQGGDDAALFLTYIQGMSAQLWDGRSPVQQLQHIRTTYSVPSTIIREYKPGVTKEYALRKYDIAKAMCDIATAEVAPYGQFKVETMNSGVRITKLENGAAAAMVLIRYSNTGPAFTASGETVKPEDGTFMFQLGAAIMEKAVAQVKEQHGEFDFSWGKDANDLSPFVGKMTIEEAVSTQ